jgi:hypothetical protein
MSQLALKDSIVKFKESPPSAKAKDDIARISDLFVKSAIFDETLRLERISIGIDFLVTSHTPFNAIWVNGRAYFGDKRYLAINS